MRIKSIFITFLLSILLLQPAFPQCSGPSCGVPNQPSYGSPYGSYGSGSRSPGYSAPSVSVDPEVAQKIRYASVRVASILTARTTAYGSGTIFSWGDSVGILTAGHVVEDGSSVSIIHETLGNIPCEVLVYNSETDYAILEPKEKQEELWKLAIKVYSGEILNRNSKIVLAGFAGTTRVTVRGAVFEKYSVVTGRRVFGRSLLIIGDIRDYINKTGLRPILGFKSTIGVGMANWMEIQGIARSGDSGGGVFTEDGLLVGNIWGSDMHNSVMATWFGPASSEIGKTCNFSWRRRPNPGQGGQGTVPPGSGDGPSGIHNSPPSGDHQDGPSAGGSNGDNTNPHTPPNPENKPSPATFNLIEFFRPTLLVLLTYVTFLVTSVIFYLVALFKRN